MVADIRKYEFAFLLKEGEPAKGAIERIKELVAKGKGKIAHENDVGNRQLAYIIHKNREKFSKAHYYFLQAEMAPKALPDLERHVKIDEGIIRYMVTLED